MLFGKYELTDRLEFSIPSGILILERIGEGIVRIRRVVKSVESSKIISITPGFTIDLKAIPPLAGSTNTSCLYITLEEPILLPGGSILEYELLIPVDLGVFIGNSIVDIVPLGRVKYALYGPPDMGDICRYVDSGILASYGNYIARAKTVFKSESSETIEISHLVLPSKNTTMYSTTMDKLYFSDVVVRVRSPLHVEVEVKGESTLPLPGLLLTLFKGAGALYIMKHGVK